MFGVNIHFADKSEAIKKQNDISIYKEIVAYTEGKQLDKFENKKKLEIDLIK